MQIFSDTIFTIINTMKKSQLLIYGCAILLITVFFTTVMTGCATTGSGRRSMTGVSRYFDKDVNTVWDAVIQAAEGIPLDVRDKEKGLLRTNWVVGRSTTKTSGLLLEGTWQERYRFHVRVAGEGGKTYVSINAQMEDKPPGGSAAYRWNRVESDGSLEQDFLKKLETILGSK